MYAVEIAPVVPVAACPVACTPAVLAQQTGLSVQPLGETMIPQNGHRQANHAAVDAAALWLYVFGALHPVLLAAFDTLVQ